MPTEKPAPQKMVRVDSATYRLIHNHRAKLELKTGERLTLSEALKDLLGKKS